jgi:hypothetical protein
MGKGTYGYFGERPRAKGEKWGMHERIALSPFALRNHRRLYLTPKPLFPPRVFPADGKISVDRN